RQSKWGWVPGLALLVTQSFDSAERIRKVNAPLLFIHGTMDDIVPHTMSDELYADAVSVSPENKHVVKIEGARHWGAIGFSGDTYDRAVHDFVRSAPRPRSSVQASRSRRTLMASPQRLR